MDTAQTDQELLEKEFNTNLTLPIDEMIGGDKEVPIFLAEWLKNGLNASAASARVLGSKKLLEGLGETLQKVNPQFLSTVTQE